MSSNLDRTAVLRSLDFGKVDAESEPDLDQRFVRTADFEEFTQDDKWIAIGPKGTGKSALFELFAKFEPLARQLAPGALENVIITTGTGFSDLSELGTADIEQIRLAGDYEHARLWRLYIAVRAAMGLMNSDIKIYDGPLRGLLQALNQVPDNRVLPLMRELWNLWIGEAPGDIKLSAGGAALTLSGGKRVLDVQSILDDINGTLLASGRTVWILFDKIDEIFPADPAERRRALEALVAESMAIRRAFPAIQPKLLIRSDLWEDLYFTNKDHTSDKRVELTWNRKQLALLLLKRACASEEVRALLEETVPALRGNTVEALSEEDVEKGLLTIFPPAAYVGEKEAPIIDWITQRVTDAKGTVLPRESIMMANRARTEQLAAGETPASSLLSREAVRKAFEFISKERVSGYLREFPDIEQHIKRFRGETTFDFSREALEEIMKGLTPSGLDMLDRLYEVGMLKPDTGVAATARSFEVPRLYRIGLGLVIRGRP